MIGMRKQWDAAFSIPDRRQLYEWAAGRIGRPKGWTRTFDINSSRHFIEPFQHIHNELVREVNIMAPVQSGKSLISDVSACYWRANNPGPHLWLLQDDDIAREYAESRAIPLLRSIPEIASQMQSGSKTRKQEIVFLDGERLVVWGPALGNLQTFGYRYVTCDELWRWKAGTLKEAKGRLSAYVKMSLDKLLCISQGGVQFDDWDFQFESGEVRLWCVRCESCGHLMYPEWSGFREDGTRWGMRFDLERISPEPDSPYNKQKAMDSARFECEKCGHIHANSARTRSNWNLSGEYKTKGEENPKVKSCRWNAIIDMDWIHLVKDFVESKQKMESGINEDIIAFFQKKMAEPASEAHMHEGKINLKRAEVKSEEISGQVFREVTVDTQARGVKWLTARIWTKNPIRSYRAMFRKCFNDSEVEEAVAEFKPTQINIHVGGYKFPHYAVFIDSRYNTYGQSGVYALCAKNKWLAVQGDHRRTWVHTRVRKNIKGETVVDKINQPYSEWTFMDPLEGMSGAGRTRCARAFFCSNTFRDKMQAMIDKESWIEPLATTDPDMEREYEKQMNSEFRKPKIDKFTGDKFMHWVSPNKNNHAADCGKMQVFGAASVFIL